MFDEEKHGRGKEICLSYRIGRSLMYLMDIYILEVAIVIELFFVTQIIDYTKNYRF